MGDQMEKKFTWILEKFSSLEDKRCYSRLFTVDGYNWHLFAHRKGDRSDGYLSLYLELADHASLPSGWKRQVKISLTLDNLGWGKSNKVLGGQCCFDAKNKAWGYSEFVSLTKLHEKGEGFLVNNRLIILAEVHVLPAIVLPAEPVKTTDPLSSVGGNQASDASVSKSQGGSSCQVAQITENASKENLDEEDASEEGSDDDEKSEEGSDDDDDGDTSEEDPNDEGSDDDETSEEGSDDDASEEDPNDEGSDDDSQIVGNHGTRCNSLAAETEVSNGENDDAPKEDVDDEASSHVSNDSARNGSSLDQEKSLEDASQTVENGARRLNTVASVTETSENVLMETQSGKETMDVNGFKVFSSQVESVSHIFKRHPDIAIGFRPKNQQIKRAYMDALLSLIEMLCQSPEKLAENDLSNAEDTLVDLTDAGFKLEWLKTKLNEISKKKKMEQGSRARLQTMEEELQKLKQMFLDLESQLQKEKVEALAARAPLSFNNVVC